jgi:hypothetical protein
MHEKMRDDGMTLEVGNKDREEVHTPGNEENKTKPSSTYAGGGEKGGGRGGALPRFIVPEKNADRTFVLSWV